MCALRNLEPWSFSLVLTTHKGVVSSTFITPGNEKADQQNRRNRLRFEMWRTFMSWVNKTRFLWWLKCRFYLRQSLRRGRCLPSTAFPSASRPSGCESSRSRRSWSSTGCRWLGTNLCTWLICRRDSKHRDMPNISVGWSCVRWLWRVCLCNYTNLVIKLIL